MISDEEREAAERRMDETLRRHPRAIRARYDRRRSRIVIRLDTGLDILLPTRLVQGLREASPDHLSSIEISPTGLGLYWPMLDTDLYVPGLLDGCFGTRAWMAELAGSSATSKSA